MPEPVKTPETKPESSSEKFSLPDRNFFGGDNMRKWAEHNSLFEKPIEEKPAESAAPADDDCPGCPGGKRKPPETKTAVESDYEKELKEREKTLAEAYKTLEEIAGGIRAGKIRVAGEEEPQKKTEETEPDYDEDSLDPAAKKRFAAQKAEIDSMKEELGYVRKKREQEIVDTASSQLSEAFKSATTEFPITEVVDPETGSNVTQEAIAGLIVNKVTRDMQKKNADPKYELKPMKDYIRSAVKDYSKLQGQGATTRTATPTAEDFVKNNPALAEEISNKAVAAYLEKNKHLPPNPRAMTDTIRRAPTASEPKKITGIDDAIRKALQDKTISEGLKEMGRSAQK